MVLSSLSSLLDLASSLFAALESLPPALLWGCFLRLYGALFAFAIGMLYSQIVPLGGRDGLFPIADRLERIRVDEPSRIKRVLMYPTLHWMASSDRALKGWILFGAVVGGGLVVSGVASTTGFAIMWAVYLSHTTMLNFMYPWDCLLMESAFLSLFLPSLSPFTLSMESAPPRLVAFLFRLLLFRVLFGFGKFKFIGASTKEFSYLRGFMANQPLPSIFGWLMYHLPLPVHQMNLAVFFLSEMVVPWFYFSSGSWRILAGLTTMGLMGAIHLTGTFGFFNLLTGILCIPMLDGAASLFGAAGSGGEETLWAQATAHGLVRMLQHAVLCFLLLLSIFFFPFNSWCTTSFFHWPGLSWPSNPVGSMLRALAPYHVVHAFGVFFAASSAGVRWIPIIEGTCDERINELHDTRVGAGGIGSASEEGDDGQGVEWEEYEYMYMTTRTDSMPRFCAPWHQRLDQAILYEATGTTPETLIGNLTSGTRHDFNPRPGSSMLGRVCACLIQGNKDVESLFRTNPFPSSGKAGKKLQALRISFYLFAPSTMSEFLSSSSHVKGHFWHKRHVSLHAPLVTRKMVERSLAEGASLGVSSDNFGQHRIREPECGHPEMIIAAMGTRAVKELLDRFDGAVLEARSSSAKKAALDSAALIATPPWVAAANTPLLQPISRSQVEDELFGPKGLIAALGPLVQRVQKPVSDAERAAVESDQLAPVPAQDWEFHLGEGEWSSAVAEFLASADSPFRRPEAGGFDARTRARVDKMVCRATLLLVHALAPYFHGPGADEQTTLAQRVAAFSEPGGPGKTGRYCLRPCIRDRCTVKEHLHLPGFLHLYCFAQHILLQGRDAFEHALLRPEEAGKRWIPSWSLCTGLLLTAVFHPALLAAHAQKMRLVLAISFPYQLEHGSILPGFLSVYYSFLAREYRTTAEGAFAPTQRAFPRVDRPQRFDQYWVVHHEDMKVRDAVGLVDSRQNSSASSSKAKEQ